MQICGEDPIKNPDAPALRENIFAFGDITHTKLNEEKSILAIRFLADYLMNNIIEVSEGKPASHKIP